MAIQIKIGIDKTKEKKYILLRPRNLSHLENIHFMEHLIPCQLPTNAWLVLAALDSH
jgi:hypothetical protein